MWVWNMAKKPQVPRLPLKEEIRRKAENGVFNRNPLLAIPHEVICKDCGYKNKAVFLEYLKSGQFEVGDTEVIEVTFAAPTSTGLSRNLERTTPIIIQLKCEKCGTLTSHSPMSLEYLLFTTRKKERSGIYI